jgi:hypothetical protein
MISNNERRQTYLSPPRTSIPIGFTTRIIEVSLSHLKVSNLCRIQLLLRQKDDLEDLRTKYGRRVRKIRGKANRVPNAILLNTRSFMRTLSEIAVN